MTKKLLLFVQTYQNRKDIQSMEMSRDNDQKEIESLYMEMSRDNDKKWNVKKQQFPAPESIFKFHCQKTISSFSYQQTISFTLNLRHYCFLGQNNWYGKLDFGECQDSFERFFSPKMAPTTGMLNIYCSRKTTRELFACCNISQKGRQISTSSSDWGVSWSLQPKTLVEKKTCTQCWHDQCPKTWMNYSKWLTRLLK